MRIVVKKVCQLPEVREIKGTLENLITIVGTVVAMAFIVFIVLLFSMLLSKLVSLVTNIVTELQYRV